MIVTYYYLTFLIMVGTHNLIVVKIFDGLPLYPSNTS